VTVEPSLEFEHTPRVWATRVVMLGLGVLLLWAGIYNFGPAWTAHRGGGVHGTFTATAHKCGRCSWYGSFTPSGGGEGLGHVRMGGGAHDINAIGDAVPAIDTGAVEVFPADGGSDWIPPLAAIVVGSVLLILWCVRVLRPQGRRPREPAPDPARP